MDGTAGSPIPRASAGASGDGYIYRIDHTGCGIEYPGGAFDDRDGPREGHCCTAVHGINVRANSQNFSVAGIHDWRNRNDLRADIGLFVRMDRGYIPADPP